MRRPWVLSVALIIVAASVAGIWIGSQKLDESRVRFALDEAKKEMAAGRYALASKRLNAVSPTRSAGGEVEYQLGLCELYRGHRDLATAAWERVPDDSPFAVRAAVQRGMLLIEQGQFTRSEAFLTKSLANFAGRNVSEIYHALELLYQLEGRKADLRRSILASWESSDDAAGVVKQLYRLDTSPLPLALVTSALEKADPNDDRVSLGKANLAIRTGQFDTASKELDACLTARPADPVVWRAKLDLALARGDLAATWTALEKLPATALSEIELAKLRAWLAEHQEEPTRERAELLKVAELEPGDTTTLERLATLANNAGDKEGYARFRARQSEMAAAKEEYKNLLRRDSIGDPAQLARLAKILGRATEANGWSAIRDGKATDPGKARPPIEPAASASATEAMPGPSLAERCTDLRLIGPSPRPSSAATAIPRFVDAAKTAGLSFVQENGASSQKMLPETMSGGVALLDYDRDGWLDIYAVQGGEFPPIGASSCGDRLYRNRGDGTFEDATERAGISRFAGGYGHGVAVGDYDNDGDPDLFITRWNAYALYRNRGDGRFEDATVAAGFAGTRDWPTSAAWADLDGDSDLDLYVCHYLTFDPNNPPLCINAAVKKREYCTPRQFTSLKDHVFRNDGGHFVDVTAVGGFVDPDGRGLGVVAAHLDDDDKIDLYVANDMSANYLFRNLGGFRFEETALAAGAAANSSGGYQSGMGIACGDLDGDGRPDLAVTNYFGESTTLFHNDGQGLFSDRTMSFGLAIPSRNMLGFGISFLDANNDGGLDLLTANGHVSDLRPAFPSTMPIQLMLGQPGGRLEDVSSRAGSPFKALHLGRGLAVGDLNNDGLVDGVVMSLNEPLILLMNRTQPVGHWLTLQLEGVVSNRDAIGARVEVRSGTRRLFAQRIGGGSYQSANGPRLHFGIGDSSRIDSIQVRWPSGRVDQLSDLACDHAYLLREANATALAIPGLAHGPKLSK
jgi:tetratricopeptide (TPR) repeat protein